MRSSSAPASRLYPTTSATRIAASFRVSLIASRSGARDWHTGTIKRQDSIGLQFVSRAWIAARSSLGKDRRWRNPRLQPKTASPRLPPVHRADLEGRLRVGSRLSTEPSECPLRKIASRELLYRFGQFRSF